MATGTASGSVLEQAEKVAEQAFRELMSGKSLGPALVPEIERIAPRVAEAAGAVAIVAGGEEAGVFGAIIAGLGELIVLVFLFEVVISIRILRWIEQLFLAVIGNIWVIGPGAGHVVKNIFSIIDPLENAVAIACANLAVGLIQNTIDIFTALMSWAGYQVFAPGHTDLKPATQFQQIEKEITVISRQVAYLTAHMGTVNYTVTDPHNTAGLPRNIWDELHGLHVDVLNLKKAMSTTQGRVDIQGRSITTVEHQIAQLTANVHAVRAVSTGWQDVERSVGQLQSTLTSFVNVTTADINTSHRQLAQLQPLTLLLTAGMPGLKVLRQLEDTPCMCPRIPNLPSLTPEWIAMYLLITHG